MGNLESMRELVPFEFYILQWERNVDKATRYNIFNNCRIYESTLKEVKKYCRSPKKYSYQDIWENVTFYGFDALCKKLNIIFRELWSRCEYEFMVGGVFGENVQKLDGYYLVQPNIEIIAHDCIRVYKEWKKNERR